MSYEGSGEKEEGSGIVMSKWIPVVVVDVEKKKAHKTWYITLYNKLFGGQHQK